MALLCFSFFFVSLGRCRSFDELVQFTGVDPPNDIASTGAQCVNLVRVPFEFPRESCDPLGVYETFLNALEKPDNVVTAPSRVVQRSPTRLSDQQQQQQNLNQNEQQLNRNEHQIKQNEQQQKVDQGDKQKGVNLQKAKEKRPKVVETDIPVGTLAFFGVQCGVVLLLIFVAVRHMQKTKKTEKDLV